MEYEERKKILKIAKGIDSTDVETEMTVTKLKEDIIRLREENAGLIKVMSKFSEDKN